MLGARVATIDLRTAPPAPKQADAELQTPEHRAWSEFVCARAGWRCEWINADGSRCGASRDNGNRLFADHIKERRDGGARYDPSNGQCLCGRHHTIKTNEERRRREP